MDKAQRKAMGVLRRVRGLQEGVESDSEEGGRVVDDVVVVVYSIYRS